MSPLLASTEFKNELPLWDSGTASEPDEQVVINQIWDEVRRFMWNYVGIVRSHQRLKHALEQVRIHQREIQAYYEKSIVSRDLIELRNLAQTAELIIMAAQRRKQNIGLHFNPPHAILVQYPRGTWFAFLSEELNEVVLLLDLRLRNPRRCASALKVSPTNQKMISSARTSREILQQIFALQISFSHGLFSQNVLT